MGNQGSGMHKRERTGENRHRLTSSGPGVNPPPGSSSSHAHSTIPPSSDSRAINHHRTTTSDDGCPVQVGPLQSGSVNP